MTATLSNNIPYGFNTHPRYASPHTVIGQWYKQDAWYRKLLPNGDYLMVSRRISGSWTWRHSAREFLHTYRSGEKNWASARGAMGEADRELGLLPHDPDTSNTGGPSESAGSLEAPAPG